MCVSDLNFNPGIVQKPVKQFNVNLLKAFCAHPYSRSNVAQQGSAILSGLLRCRFRVPRESKWIV